MQYSARQAEALRGEHHILLHLSVNCKARVIVIDGSESTSIPTYHVHELAGIEVTGASCYMEGALSSGYRLARRLAVRDKILPA